MSSTHSNDGREWARLSQLGPGSRVEFDAGFSCGLSGRILEVHRDPKGNLYVNCDEGEHGLAGQLASETGGDTDHLVGVWPAYPEPLSRVVAQAMLRRPYLLQMDGPVSTTAVFDALKKELADAGYAIVDRRQLACGKCR